MCSHAELELVVLNVLTVDQRNGLSTILDVTYNSTTYSNNRSIVSSSYVV